MSDTYWQADESRLGGFFFSKNELQKGDVDCLNTTIC